jgi:D-beta-D-heptose 7-phosphate kinase/D-beta-D-heptose 1-phosphate adenosyltransferase
MTYRVLVVGDIMLDRYHYGHINRISPEAPIPIFEHHNTVHVPGGAGNLIKNLDGLGIKVFALIPSMTDGEDKDILLSSLRGNNTSIVISKGEKTEVLVKTRFVELKNKHQVGFRLDQGRVGGLCKLIASESLSVAQNLASECQAVIFSDYCKATLDDTSFVSGLVEFCRERGIHTFLDSRRKLLHNFRNITYFKPNLKEYNVYLDERHYTVFPELLVTKSDLGMSYMLDDKARINKHMVPRVFCSVKALDDNIVDPTGAGDTAMAGWVYAILNGFRRRKSMFLANTLASIACKHKGTYAVTKNDLNKALCRLSSEKNP